MKVKRKNKHRKAVRFYTACFGFRQPFKILCDGTFVHHLLTNQITPADTALARTLGDPVKLFTTRCVLAELRSLGESYSEAFNASRNLITARCEHEKRKSAVACLTEVIGEKNTEHFFVATQDADLRKKFQEVPGVPLIYAHRNALFLERPSSIQQNFAKSIEEERSQQECEMLKVPRKRKRLAAEEPGDSSDANEDSEDNILEIKNLNENVKRNEISMKDKAQFKRKRAKGPNPLSVKKKKKKKKTKENVDAAPEKDNSDGHTSVRCRGKKRKRSRKSKTAIETTV